MNPKLSKTGAQREIEEFFRNIKDKTPKQVKKIKQLAMNKNLHLKEKRKLFCKKCLFPYSGNEKIRIKKGNKDVECKNCGFTGRWKLK